MRSEASSVSAQTGLPNFKFQVSSRERLRLYIPVFDIVSNVGILRVQHPCRIEFVIWIYWASRVYPGRG